MIVSSMLYSEVYDHIAEDFKKVEIRKQYLLPKAIKEFQKETKFPAWRCYDYKSSTGNKYVIFFYVESRCCINKPLVDHFCVFTETSGKILYVQCLLGGYKQTEDSPIVFIRQIHLFPLHFFQRYNERFWKNETLTRKDLACLYFARNRDLMPIPINERINKNIEKYGDHGRYGCRVRDGFCFSMCDEEPYQDYDLTKYKTRAMKVVFTTFMNESELEKGQVSAINEEQKLIKKQFQQDLDKMYKAGNNKIKIMK